MNIRYIQCDEQEIFTRGNNIKFVMIFDNHAIASLNNKIKEKTRQKAHNKKIWLSYLHRYRKRIS